MISRFEHLRPQVVAMRKRGKSVRDIEVQFGIPRSTLSGWLRKIHLTPRQKNALDRRWRQALHTARKEAALWHRAQKLIRIDVARQQAFETLSQLTDNVAIKELALALLYMGEGMKTGSQTAMGNSDPLLLRFFISCLRSIYNVPQEKIRCELHLRADQIPQDAVRYWSQELALPRTNFAGISVDYRTKGRPTYDTYKGVCLVRCGRVDIQRKLIYIAREFCNRISAGQGKRG